MLRHALDFDKATGRPLNIIEGPAHEHHKAGVEWKRFQKEQQEAGKPVKKKTERRTLKK